MPEITAQALRELAKWAFYAAEYDGAVSVEHLRGLHPDVATAIDEIRQLDENRSDGDSFDEI